MCHFVVTFGNSYVFNILSCLFFRDFILYLEWAPSNILCQDLIPSVDSKNDVAIRTRKANQVLIEKQLEEMDQGQIDVDAAEVGCTVLFVFCSCRLFSKFYD